MENESDELKNENPQTDSALKNENLKEQNDASEKSSQNPCFNQVWQKQGFLNSH